MAAGIFSAEEKAAMKAAAAERREQAKREKAANKAELDLKDVLDKIAGMPEADRNLAMKVHELITAAAPELYVRTWYGMPAYYKDGKPVCFFQSGAGYGSRYCTLGFQDKAALDDGTMWPSSFAVVAIGKDEEKRIAQLVQRAAGGSSQY